MNLNSKKVNKKNYANCIKHTTSSSILKGHAKTNLKGKFITKTLQEKSNSIIKKNTLTENKSDGNIKAKNKSKTILNKDIHDELCVSLNEKLKKGKYPKSVDWSVKNINNDISAKETIRASKALLIDSNKK